MKEISTQKTKGRASPYDEEIGCRLKIARAIRGLSQEKAGKGIGLTFQQIQKYEKGTNRVAASTLYELSKLYEFPVECFLIDLEKKLCSQELEALANKVAEKASSFNFIGRYAGLISAYEKLPNKMTKKLVVRLINTWANSFPPNSIGRDV